MGFEGWPTKRELEKFLIRGIALSEEKSGRRPSDPMTFEVVKEIRKSLDKKSWKSSSKNTFWASVCVGYFGAFRASELLIKENWHVDYSSDLVWSDVKFHGKNSVKIKIRNPKTGGGKFELVELFKFPNKQFCPVRASKVLKKQAKEKKNCCTQPPQFSVSDPVNALTYPLSRKLSKNFSQKANFEIGIFQQKV